MSLILGLNLNHADSSACLIKDNELKFGVEEERINRHKHWAGFPSDSIKLCLESCNIRSEDLTDVAINTNPLSNLNQKILFFIKNYLTGKKKIEIFSRLKKKYSLYNNFEKAGIKLSKKIKFHYIDHHLSHIASAYYASGYNNAWGLSIDGFGDFCSIAISKCEKKKIKIIKKIFFPNSLGLFYEAFTQLIGFKKYGEEYKVMGLSSYGKPEYQEIIEKNFFEDKNKIIDLNLKYFNHIDKNFEYKYEGCPEQNTILKSNALNILGLKNSNFSKEIQSNIASSIQNIFEKKIIHICELIKKTKFSNNLVYAGGCALNSLANKKIFDKKLFQNVYIPYAPGDAGGSIGAALQVSAAKNKTISNLQSPFIGPSYSNSLILREIEKFNELKKCKINFNTSKKNINSLLAKEIHNNKIIGLFSGRMEFGARSLGNRAIIANPCNPDMRNILNQKIKRRENFRPFAPAILENEKSNWFYDKKSNPFMSSVETIIEKKRKIIPAVTHIDGTGRVQTVSENTNENFYNLIKEFFKISGVPILLNTSFNENEPIVMQPSDAIKCFLKTNIDILVLENYIIER